MLTQDEMVSHDVAIVGGGVIGTSIGKHLVEDSDLDVCIIEKEYHLGAHQSGRNSGVIHPGFSYEPETLQARQATRGARMLKEYCRENGVRVDEGGILVVAKDESEREGVEKLHRNGQANGVETEILEGEAAIQEHEPNATGVAALHCPEGGSVDFLKYLYTLAKDAEAAGVQYYMGHRLEKITVRPDNFVLRTSNGTIEASYLVNAAGLYADKIAHAMDIGTEYQVVPFRGVYYEFTPDEASMIESNIYPVPDPDYTSVGIHFTRRTDDKVIVGPNIALSFGREAYDPTNFDLGEFLEVLKYEGFWNMMKSPKSWLVARDELSKSYSKRLFVRDGQGLIPGLQESDLVKSYTGIVAKVLKRDGELIDEQVYLHGDQSTHVMYVIPGLTSSLAIGEYVANEVEKRFESAATAEDR
jgi:L-2-hydroxyglutarate oxidase